MAYIKREVLIDAPLERVWSALRDVGSQHTRLVPGFVVDTRLDGGDRLVTFGDGTVVRERLVDIDDADRRVAWSAVGAPFSHHNASAQLFTHDDQHTRFVWIADLLPNELAPRITGMIEAGLAVIKRTLEQR
jgi:carbon monoxide dehydrogenase subunit G